MHRLELLNPAAAVFGYIDVALRVHGNAVSLVEFAGEMPGVSESGKDLTGFAVQDLYLLIVLVEQVHELLIRIAREVQRHCRATALFRLTVSRRGVRCPRRFDVLLKVAE